MPKTKASKPTQVNPEVELLKSQLVRALADYDNLQKRTEKMTSELYFISSQRVIKRLLPILDMLYGAQEHLKDGGLSIVIKEFEQVLYDDGFEKIEPKSDEIFNELTMEAIEVLETAGQDLDNTIEKVSLVGWKQGEQIVRPAKVVVRKVAND